MIFRFYRTIKRLKWIQIFNRFTRKISQTNTSLKHCSFLPQKISVPFLVNKITYKNNKFSYIGINSTPENLEDLPLLWQYNFFYCDFLMSKNISYEEKKYLILQICSLLKLPSSIGKDPYPTSLRIVNLIKWISSVNDNFMTIEIKKLLNSDYERLINKIEYHLLGNHILTNFKALIFHDIFFQHSEKNVNLVNWLKNYELQLQEQILNDGGHFELSHMYQNIIIEDITDILNILNCKEFITVKENLSNILEKMIGWTNYLTNTAGNLFYTNDCVDGIAKSTEELNEYAKKIFKAIDRNLVNYNQNNFITLPETGFSRIKTNSFFLCVNHANVEARYIPGHFHADTLSFEISNNLGKILCNPGLSTYAESNDRAFERSTLSHNCLSINGQNSSEVWSSFRLGRSAEIISFESNSNNDETFVKASHDGFDKVKHSRSWIVSNDRIIIHDEVISDESFFVDINFIVHPTYEILSFDSKELIINYESSTYRLSFQANQNFKLSEEPAYHCPNFGIKQDTSSILLSIEKKDKIKEFKTQFTIEEI